MLHFYELEEYQVCPGTFSVSLTKYTRYIVVSVSTYINNVTGRKLQFLSFYEYLAVGKSRLLKDFITRKSFQD